MGRQSGWKEIWPFPTKHFSSLYPLSSLSIISIFCLSNGHLPSKNSSPWRCNDLSCFGRYQGYLPYSIRHITKPRMANECPLKDEINMFIKFKYVLESQFRCCIQLATELRTQSQSPHSQCRTAIRSGAYMLAEWQHLLRGKKKTFLVCPQIRKTSYIRQSGAFVSKQFQHIIIHETP